MKTKYNEFWQWFVSKAEYFYLELEQHPDEIAIEISNYLALVHPEIVFDIPFELVNNKREFIISADGDPLLFDTIFEFVEEAPQLKHWSIIALRPRTNQQDQAIDLDGLYLEYEDIFYVTHNEHLPLAIDVYIKGYDVNDNRYVHGYFLLLDTLLGEYDAVTLIDHQGVHPYSSAPSHAQRFLILRDEIDRLK